MVIPKEAIYILGKIVWQLWTGQHPRPSDQLPADMAEPARSIINDCIEYRVESIEGLRRKYVNDRLVCTRRGGFNLNETSVMESLQEKRRDARRGMDESVETKKKLFRVSSI